MAMAKPKRGSRTAKHVSVKQAKEEMGRLMHNKTNGRRTEAQKEKRNKEHKYR